MAACDWRNSNRSTPLISASKDQFLLLGLDDALWACGLRNQILLVEEIRVQLLLVIEIRWKNNGFFKKPAGCLGTINLIWTYHQSSFGCFRLRQVRGRPPVGAEETRCDSSNSCALPVWDRYPSHLEELVSSNAMSWKLKNRCPEQWLKDAGGIDECCQCSPPQKNSVFHDPSAKFFWSTQRAQVGCLQQPIQDGWWKSVSFPSARGNGWERLWLR